MLLVSAAFACPLGDSAEPPGEIVYIPEGKHEILPLVDGKPKRITVNLPADQGDRIAAAFQSNLTDRLSANVRPHLDFDHAGRGPAAGIPKSFRYQKGKGLILALDWTDKGRDAVKGRDYSYFSPEFLLDEDHVPAGLADMGAVGALVNEPAFRDIPRIAAMDSSKAASEPNPTPYRMNQFVQCGLLNSQEAALPEALELATKRVKAMSDNAAPNEAALKEKDDEIATLKAKIAEMERVQCAAAKTRADNLVQAAVTDGRIPKNDEATQTKFREQIAAGNVMAEEFLAALQKQPDPSKPVIKAGEKGKEDEKSEPTGLARVTAAFAAEHNGGN